MDKTVSGSAAAVADVPDGASIMIGGFGVCGVPENLLAALIERGTKGLTLISNNAGLDGFGIGVLIKRGQVKKMIMSYGGECKAFEEAALSGAVQVEWTPQGTLAERMRAGGAGVAAFYTPTGYGTPVAEGKETRQFDGRWYVLERGLTADFAFVKAWKADAAGNLEYRMTARNFNQVMATAGRVVIAESEQVVEVGGLHPGHIHTPGIYVDRVLKGEAYPGRIEKLTVRRRGGTGA